MLETAENKNPTKKKSPIENFFLNVTISRSQYAIFADLQLAVLSYSFIQVTF